MKRSIYICMALALMLASCNKFLEETPKGSLIPKTVDDMGMILDNTFEINPGIGNTLAYSNDIRGLDNLVLGYTQADINTLTFSDHIYGPNENDADWNRFYHSISLCNFVVDNIDNAPQGVDNLHEKKTVKGRALFHRAYSFFLLVNSYAKHYNSATAANDPGIPLLLHADVNAVVIRASVKEVYDQMIADALQARELLPASAEYTFRPTKLSANAFLATIYLYQGRFTEAWQHAKLVTSAKTLKDYNTVTRNVPDDPRNGFKALDPLEWKREDILYYREPKGMFRNFLFITNDLLGTYDQSNDLRYLLFLTTKVLNTHSAWGMDRTSGITLSDAYLTEAEGKVRDNNVPVSEVLSVLNAFVDARYKTGYPDITEMDRELLKQRILTERRKETCYRSLRLFDIKRLEVQDNRQESLVSIFQSQTYTIPPGGNKMVMPIPLNVIAKSNIAQNPR